MLKFTLKYVIKIYFPICNFILISFKLGLWNGNWLYPNLNAIYFKSVWINLNYYWISVFQVLLFLVLILCLILVSQLTHIFVLEVISITLCEWLSNVLPWSIVASFPKILVTSFVRFRFTFAHWLNAPLRFGPNPMLVLLILSRAFNVYLPNAFMVWKYFLPQVISKGQRSRANPRNFKVEYLENGRR